MDLKLSECELNRYFIITKIILREKEIEHRLKCLGFLEKEKIKILKYNYNKTCYLIKIMGVNYMIDKKICEGIIVSV